MTLSNVKKIISGILVSLLLTTQCFATPKIVKVKDFKGLKRSPSADKIDGFAKFDNVLIEEANIRAVKGRDRLNSTALTNVTTNGIWYYENAAGTTKKIVRMENTVLASYDTDGTNRTSLNTGLTNEKHDAVQIGDTLYITSDTDGLYKWTGSGAATAITGVSTPSTVDFSATTGHGGLTSGLPAIVVHTITGGGGSVYQWSGAQCAKDSVFVADHVEDNTACGSLSGSFVKTCATTSTYKYKVSSWNSKYGYESEASTVDSSTLTGSNTVNVAGRSCFRSYSDSACTTADAVRCTDTTIDITGEQTVTTGTLASAPSAPFDGYCIYRTVANGTDYFKLGCVVGGGTAYTDGIGDTDLDHPFDTTIDTIDPPSFRFIDEYKGAIFLAQGNTINFTRNAIGAYTDVDKYWLSTDSLDTGASNPLTGMKKTANSLLFFTSNKVMELTGFGISSFRFRTVLEGVGSVSDETIETDNNGDIIFFAGIAGVYKLKVGEQRVDPLTGSIQQTGSTIERISSVDLDNVFNGTDSQIVLSPSDFAASHAYFDNDQDLYFLYIGQECFIFNELNNSWSHMPATKMTASVYAKSPSLTGKAILTDNLGFMYRNWIGYDNGIESGTVTGVPTSSGNTTLTMSTAAFNTTNDGLKGLWVFLDNQNGEWRQIASNTATQITVSSAWTTNPTVYDMFYIAYVIPDFTTKQFEQVVQDAVPLNTHTYYFYLIHPKSDSTQTLYVETYENKKTTAENATSFDLSLRYVEKLALPGRSNWTQYNFKTFIYNISDSISNPLDINSYALEIEEASEDIA